MIRIGFIYSLKDVMHVERIFINQDIAVNATWLLTVTKNVKLIIGKSTRKSVHLDDVAQEI